MELMMAVLILLPLFTSVVLTYIRATQLNSLAQNISMVTRGCRNQLVQIEGTAFNQVYATYNDFNFNIPGINGVGVVYVDNSNPDLIEVSLSFSWKESNGRILGEDLDLDGAIDIGEDVNNNGELDSIVGLRTVIYNI